MTRLALLILPFLLAAPASAQGLILGAPAQGVASGGGGGSGTVNVAGSGLAGDGSEGDPLTLDAILQEIVDHWTIGDDGDAELPSLLATSHLTLGAASTAGVRLEVNSGRLDVREGDDSALADLGAALVAVADADAALATLLSGASLSAANTRLLVATEDAAPTRFYALSDTAGNGTIFQASRFRGTIASPTALSSGDLLFEIAARGATTASITGDQDMAKIRFIADGAVGAGDAPGAIEFWVNADGGGNSSTLRHKIGNAGNLDSGASQHVFGASVGSPDVGLVRDGVANRLKVSNGSTGSGSLRIPSTAAGTGLILGTADSDGWSLVPISSIAIRILDGDGTDVEDGCGFTIGNSAGRPRINTTDYSPSEPTYSAFGDDNSGYGFVEADAPAIAAEGQWRKIISNTLTITEGTASNLVTIPLSAGQDCSGILHCHIRLNDGTDTIRIVRSFSFAAADKAGVLSSNGDAWAENTPGVSTSHAIDDGPTFAIVDGTNAISISLDVGAAGTNTVTVAWTLDLHHSAAGAEVTIP